MTIKEIKQKYEGKYGNGEKMTIVTYDFGDGNGKVAVITTYVRSYGRTVWQAVRVSDGKELIEEGRCRPCDNLDDAIDVAGEMMNG